MAYYDPYDNNNSYYSPESNVKQKTGDPVKAAGGFLVKMVGYGLLQGVATTALKFAGGKATKLAAGIAKHRAPKSAFAKNLAKINSNRRKTT